LDLSSYNNDISKRIFIGLDIPDDISLFFYEMISELSKSNNYIRPVPPRNIHLTLKFVGNTGIRSLEKIKRCLKEELKNTYSFEYNIEDRIDAFPRLKNARIIYGITGTGKEKIENVQKKIIKAISFLNIKEENKKFIPHITIARIKHSCDLTKIVSYISPKAFTGIKCDKITIYESILSEKGADYFINEQISLKNRM